jgi:hypothetical protein
VRADRSAIPSEADEQEEHSVTPVGVRRDESSGVSVKPFLQVTLRCLCALLGLAQLFWAYQILSNIWGYNDSGTLIYLAYGSIPAVTGALLVGYAILGGRLGRRRP